jgi:hypothetical protein
VLDPEDRASLYAALRPPDGFQLDVAVGTSFTLDLEAMLTAPLSFALYEASAADPTEPAVEPVGLLEAIRRSAERITLFCQAGQIAVPRRRRAIFAWLEDSVIEVSAPRRGRLFHPKVWVVRYRSEDRSVLRVLCATRNLTFDTSWDTLLRLESEPFAERGDRAVDGQHELADLVRRLPRLGHHGPAHGRRQDIVSLADDLERVPLVPPDPFTSVDLHVFGLGPPRPLPFPRASTAAVVVSPFLGESLLERLLDEHELTALVSREESLDRITPATLAQIGRLGVLNDALDVVPPDVGTAASSFPQDGDAPAGPGQANETVDPGRQLAGLHAKLFVFDTSAGTQLFTGSANATEAAFGGNVEVLAELRGPTEVGAASLVEEVQGETTFADLLVDYRPPDEPVEPDATEDLRQGLDRLRVRLAAARFRAAVTPSGEDFLLTLTSDTALPKIEADECRIAVWPITLDEASSAQELAAMAAPNAAFAVSLEGISAFFAFRVSAREGTARATTTFLVKALLDGAPPDRHRRLLASMLRDKDRLLRYLLLLLHDDADADWGTGPGQGSAWTGRWLAAGWDEPPLLEVLLRALDRHPERLDHLERLLHDLGDERDGLLPARFSEVWEPIWAQRQGGRS